MSASDETNFAWRDELEASTTLDLKTSPLKRRLMLRGTGSGACPVPKKVNNFIRSFCSARTWSTLDQILNLAVLVRRSLGQLVTESLRDFTKKALKEHFASLMT